MAAKKMANEPTATVGLREDLRTELTPRFYALKGAIRKTVGYTFDALELRQSPTTPRPRELFASADGSTARELELAAAADDINPAQSFEFTTEQGARDEFLGWLEQQINRGIVETIDRPRIRNGEHYTARYIRSAYSRGVEHADAQLNEHGVEVPEQTLQQTFDRGVAQQDLEQLYSRAFTELEGITDDLQQEIRRELATGYSQGWNPQKMARNLNERTDTSISRAERFARTEIMNSHGVANRSRLREFGVQKVDILGSSPCPEICAPIIAGSPYKIDDIPRGGCPLHPNCKGTEVPATDPSGNILTASASDVARTAA
jgi:hypothetical protein